MKEKGTMKLFAVIIAGGSGERLWPLSTSERPKQFVTLFGGVPLIAQAVERVDGMIAPENVLVVTGEALVAQTVAALPKLPRANILGEPCRRNTAAAVALAVREVRARAGDDAVIAILTADHLIEPAAAFRSTLAKAVDRAFNDRRIVTIGIRPTYAATGFGYIDAAAEPPRFVEKPDRARAEEFLRAGHFLWNSGMFIFRADVMAAELAALAPSAARLLDAADWRALYPELESISIDYAVMEKTAAIAVVPSEFEWSDVGSWSAVADRFGRDGDGNTLLGDVTALDTTGTLVVAEKGRRVAVLGLADAVVVETGTATLVASASKLDRMRALVAALGK